MRPPCDSPHLPLFLSCQQRCASLPFPLLKCIYSPTSSTSYISTHLFISPPIPHPSMASFPTTTTTTLVLLLLLFLHLTLSIPTSSAATQSQNPTRRNMVIMEDEEEDAPLKPPPKKKTTLETKNQTKLIKPKKSNSTSSTTTSTTTTKIKLNKLNKTLTSTTKPSNSTKLPKLIKPIKSNSTKTHLKSINSTSNGNPLKPLKKLKELTFPPKNKTSTTATTTTKSKIQQQPTTKPTSISNKKPKKEQIPSPVAKTKKQDETLSWLEQDTDSDGGEDLIAEFRGLPSRLLPDLERLSITSKAYISKASKEITDGVKPYVGHRYAPAAATAASAALLALPLLLLTLLFHRLRTYLSLQRVLVFIQAYLAIYFATLAATAVVTGLEPLRFFYAVSPSSYACTQAMQTLGYVLYLLAQMVHLVAVFSSATSGAAARTLSLAQMVVGLAVGMHYYAVVFHRAAAGEPPRANWRVHAAYAAAFLVICACAGAERRKKEYLPVDGGDDDGKKS